MDSWISDSVSQGRVYTEVTYYRVITKLDQFMTAVSINRQIRDEVQGLGHKIICRKEVKPAKDLAKEEPVREGKLGV